MAGRQPVRKTTTKTTTFGVNQPRKIVLVPVAESTTSSKTEGGGPRKVVKVTLTKAPQIIPHGRPKSKVHGQAQAAKGGYVLGAIAAGTISTKEGRAQYVPITSVSSSSNSEVDRAKVSMDAITEVIKKVPDLPNMLADKAEEEPKKGPAGQEQIEVLFEVQEVENIPALPAPEGSSTEPPPPPPADGPPPIEVVPPVQAGSSSEDPRSQSEDVKPPPASESSSEKPPEPAS